MIIKNGLKKNSSIKATTHITTMDQTFTNPKELNPFQPTPTAVAAPVQIMYVYPQQQQPVIIVEPSSRHRWLELPGACCLAYFCGPCYMFAHLCCMICRK